MAINIEREGFKITLDSVDDLKSLIPDLPALYNALGGAASAAPRASAPIRPSRDAVPPISPGASPEERVEAVCRTLLQADSNPARLLRVLRRRTAPATSADLADELEVERTIFGSITTPITNAAARCGIKFEDVVTKTEMGRSRSGRPIFWYSLTNLTRRALDSILGPADQENSSVSPLSINESGTNGVGLFEKQHH